MILRPGIDADELQKVIKEDFEMDSLDKAKINEGDDPSAQEKAQQEFEAQAPKQYDYLDHDKLYEALFALADTWCPGIDEFEYKEFFFQLKYRLTYSGIGTEGAYDVLWRNIFCVEAL